jgi:hypothetical protein
MGGGAYFVPDLADRPLDAAAEFYTKIVPLIRDDFQTMPDFNGTIVFKTAGHEHRAWRLAAIQELAREVAPEGRVNGVVADNTEVLAALQAGGLQETIEWLQQSPGITGQLLAID